MQKVSLSFGDGYIKQNGEASIFAVLYVKKVKVKFNTGVTIAPEFWDQDAGRVRKSCPDHDDKNLMISATIARINQVFVRYKLQFKDLTANLLRKEFNVLAADIDFHTFWQKAVKERKGELTGSTLKMHKSIGKKIEEFSPSLSFAELDEDWFRRFNRWLTNTKKNNQNTRYNTFKILNTYLNIAVSQKRIEANPLIKNMPVKRTKAERVFLTEKELWKLVQLYDKKELVFPLQNVLRHFLFMCFTGIRVSDLKAMRMEHIIDKKLIFSAQKTSSRRISLEKIPLSNIAMDLINDESEDPERVFLFHTLSEQRMNFRLKEISAASGIHKAITTHTGRHTFATVFLRRTKNIPALQKILGHSNIEQTMVYAHILTEDVEKEMAFAFTDFSCRKAEAASI